MIKHFYRVFVSSTFVDLEEARAQINRLLLEAGHCPVSMEYQPASASSQLKHLEQRLRVSDLFLLLLGDRYGSTTTWRGEHLSYTEFEFRMAVELKIPIVPIVKKPTEATEPDQLAFHQKLLTPDRSPAYWDDLDRLPGLAIASVSRLIAEGEVVGCVPARGIVLSFVRPLAGLSIDVPLLDDFANDIADRAAHAIRQIPTIDTIPPMRWGEYCEYVHTWLDQNTREACEILAVCSQKPWDDQRYDLGAYFEMYYALAGRSDQRCPVTRLFVQGEEWDKVTSPGASAWQHIRKHVGLEGVTPLLIDRENFGCLPGRLRRYGDISGFVLIVRNNKVASAMIHQDDDEGIHAALLHHSAGDRLLPFLLGIFEDLRNCASEPGVEA